MTSASLRHNATAHAPAPRRVFVPKQQQPHLRLRLRLRPQRQQKLVRKLLEPKREQCYRTCCAHLHRKRGNC